MPSPQLILTQPSAVILGFDCITGLQTGRVLQDIGVRVTGIVSRSQHFAASSRCLDRLIELDLGAPNLIDQLIRLATPDRPVLIPATDVAVDLLTRHADALAPYYRNAIAAPAAIERSLRKTAFAQHALSHDLPIPKSRCVESIEDLRRAAQELRPPFVLKPDLKTERWDRETGVKILVADDAQALEDTYERYRMTSPSFVVQEWIEGGDDAMYSYYAYVGRNGRLVADCLAHKLRQWPRLTGSGTLAEYSSDPELIEMGRVTLESLGHQGFASVQMKRDSKNGRPGIIEVNIGRPAMGIFLAEAAGIDLMRLAYEDMAGLPPSDLPMPTHPAARWISWKRDYRAALEGWRQGELTIAEYLRSLAGVSRAAVFSLRDPLPFVIDLLRTPAKLFASKSPIQPKASARPPLQRVP